MIPLTTRNWIFRSVKIVWTKKTIWVYSSSHLKRGKNNDLLCNRPCNLTWGCTTWKAPIPTLHLSTFLLLFLKFALLWLCLVDCVPQDFGFRWVLDCRRKTKKGARKFFKNPFLSLLTLLKIIWTNFFVLRFFFHDSCLVFRRTVNLRFLPF